MHTAEALLIQCVHRCFRCTSLLELSFPFSWKRNGQLWPSKKHTSQPAHTLASARFASRAVGVCSARPAMLACAAAGAELGERRTGKPWKAVCPSAHTLVCCFTLHLSVRLVGPSPFSAMPSVCLWILARAGRVHTGSFAFSLRPLQAAGVKDAATIAVSSPGDPIPVPPELRQAYQWWERVSANPYEMSTYKTQNPDVHRVGVPEPSKPAIPLTTHYSFRRPAHRPLHLPRAILVPLPATASFLRLLQLTRSSLFVGWVSFFENTFQS